ncbi:MAG: type IV secretion system DNA-binding domain-containing protein [Ignavibacteria bacterium]|nr:type IV secretion system DNA-binding domain-containing protein [Ignavibacteria bacterium]
MDELRNDKEPITPLAVTNWRDIRRTFGIKRKNRRGHIYVIGKSGTGKSSLMGNMVISDMEQGYGLALIDPHGDLAEAVLTYVPEKRLADVIYFNPADVACPIAFNPLKNVAPDQRYLVASGLISVFKKIWAEFWGPRLEHILRFSLLTLLEYPQSTLLDLPRLLTDAQFRKEVVSGVTQREVQEFWSNEFDRYSAYFRSEAVAPILNKMGQFLTSLPLRNIVGQRQTSFTMREAMDSGKILIANVSKGRIGEDTSSLLGAMLVTEIQLAALSRADTEEHQRRPFYLYIDEVHNFLTTSVADMLSESRKFNLSITCANQFTNQLDDDVRSAILGNVGTIISFRVGPEDAELLAKEFSPVFTESDILNLPNHSIYLKLMIDGVTSLPFSATTLPLPEPVSFLVEKIIEASRKRYTRPRKEVEAEILLKARKEQRREIDQPSLF